MQGEMIMIQYSSKIIISVLGITTALATVAAVGVAGGHCAYVKYGNFNVLKAMNGERNFKSFVRKNKNNQDLLNSRNFKAVEKFVDSMDSKTLIAFPQKNADGTIVEWSFRAYYISDTEGLVESTINCALPVIDDNGNIIAFGDMRRGIALHKWKKLKQRLEKCGCKFDLDAVSQFLEDKEEQIRRAELQAVALKKVEEAKKVSGEIYEILKQIGKKEYDAQCSGYAVSSEKFRAEETARRRERARRALNAMVKGDKVREAAIEAAKAEGERRFYDVQKKGKNAFYPSSLELTVLGAAENARECVELKEVFYALKEAILSKPEEEIKLDEKALGIVNDAVRKALKKAEEDVLHDEKILNALGYSEWCGSTLVGRELYRELFLRSVELERKKGIKNALDEVVKAMNKRRDVVFDEIRLRAKIELCDKKINEFSIIKQAALDTAEAGKKDEILREFSSAVEAAHKAKEKGLPMGDVKLDALVSAVANAQKGTEEAVEKAEETVKELKAKENERDALCEKILVIKKLASKANYEADCAIGAAERAVAGYVENAEKAAEEAEKAVKKVEEVRRSVKKAAEEVEELIKSAQ